MSDANRSQPGPDDPRQGPPPPVLWNKLPPLVRFTHTPNKGADQVDERCFTYCWQTAGGRLAHRPPVCRSTCFRHVLPHEVGEVTFRSDGQQLVAGEKKYPLPPEGQRLMAYFTSLIRQSEEDANLPDLQSRTYYWDEGWYLWRSKNTYGIADKFGMMQRTLDEQAALQKRKEEVLRKWQNVDEELARRADPVVRAHPSKGRPWYADGHNDASLIPLSHALTPVTAPFQNVLGPMQRTVGMMCDNFESGATQKLAGMVWQKLKSPEPYQIARDAAVEMWKMLMNPPDDEGGDNAF
ncbi:hypothetical protein CERSUDRAFT_126276 [Gelatoporia subvermispora B]|uniref:Uncharacterized protein n=1 Tax=Ceriporiopsis subvermispora (strain B) TaxID=914234 RepID=M2QLS1_CERS8|nr:hypothetical protein CERSUDRAFT_126276 [Gelatoporia subvermispora B]